MTGSPIGYLAVGIASSADDRKMLAQLLGETEAFLIVSSVEQARQILGGVGSPDEEIGDLVARLAAGGAATAEPVVTDETPARVIAHTVAAHAVDRVMVTEAVRPAPQVEKGFEPRTVVMRPHPVEVRPPTMLTAPPVDPGLSVDCDRRVLRCLDREIGLTPLEYDFINCLIGAPGRVFTYQRLHHEVWGNELLGRGSDLHSVVRRVRAKLHGIGASATIQAVRGVGFRLAASR
jgi:DNA-binding response OmpR family regulator